MRWALSTGIRPHLWWSISPRCGESGDVAELVRECLPLSTYFGHVDTLDATDIHVVVCVPYFVAVREQDVFLAELWSIHQRVFESETQPTDVALDALRWKMDNMEMAKAECSFLTDNLSHTTKKMDAMATGMSELQTKLQTLEAKVLAFEKSNETTRKRSWPKQSRPKWTINHFHQRSWRSLFICFRRLVR